MHMDPTLPAVTAAAVVVLLVGLLLRRFKQPYVIAYLVAGILLGPSALGIFDDTEALNRLGSFGVVLLLFFVGMEVSLDRLLEVWRVALVATIIQITVSLACTVLLGMWLHWPMPRAILLGFVISLSSTAVVLKLLEAWNEMDTPAGQSVLGILLVQDVLVIPMVIVLGFLAGRRPSGQELGLQIIGAVMVIGLVVYIAKKRRIHLPMASLRDDHELQVFAALFVCSGMALFSGAMGLSAALGAFVGGLVVSSAAETAWIKDRLESFRVVFVALFFVSIGMTLDVAVLEAKLLTVSLLVLAAFVTNTGINALALRWLGVPWRRSLYASALLAQIGEFSFVLAALGAQLGIIQTAAYQLTIATISVSLLLSPLWMAPFRRLGAT